MAQHTTRMPIKCRAKCLVSEDKVTSLCLLQDKGGRRWPPEMGGGGGFNNFGSTEGGHTMVNSSTPSRFATRIHFDFLLSDDFRFLGSSSCFLGCLLLSGHTERSSGTFSTLNSKYKIKKYSVSQSIGRWRCSQWQLFNLKYTMATI